MHNQWRKSQSWLAYRCQRKVPSLKVNGEKVDDSDPFCREKLSLILAVWRSEDFDQTIELVKGISDLNGTGHSCGIHTEIERRILKLGEQVRVSRIMVNQPQTYGNSGNYNNGVPFTLTLGCGTWGGNITSENINWKHFVNATWISKPIRPIIPDENQIFGDYWKEYGK